MLKNNLKYIIALIIIGLVLGYSFYETEMEAPDEPTIVGYVTEVEEERFLVAEAEPGVYFDSLDELEGRKIYFSIVGDTEILFENEVVDFEDVSVGDLIHAWHQGPIMESHPEQTEAKKVLVLEENFRSYESEIKGISIDIPVGGSVSYEEERLKITFVGPDSQMAEITDGFTLFVDLFDGDSEAVAEELFIEETQMLESIREPQESQFAGLKGYSFAIEGGLGNEINYFFYQTEDRVVGVNYSIMGPDEDDYMEKVERIVTSIEAKEELLTSKECVVSGCSGEVCSLDGPVETTCEALPGAECLNKASCELVENDCQWVLSTEAAQCFMGVEEEFGDKARSTRIGHLFERAEKVLN